jgi:hypothetical protein
VTRSRTSHFARVVPAPAGRDAAREKRTTALRREFSENQTAQSQSVPLERSVHKDKPTGRLHRTTGPSTMDESSDNLIANNSFGDLESSSIKEVGDEDLMMDHHSHALLQHHEDSIELHGDLALKRAHDQVDGDEMGLGEDPASKRLKLPPYIGGAAAAAAKKANHEQWETMFARLVEYKEAHGVSVSS